MKTERDNLKKEIKKLQKVTKYDSAHTDSESNNNIPARPSQILTFSRSSETSHCQSSSQTLSVITDIELLLERLSDFSEEDPFIQFVKRIHLGPDYISQRLQLYPEHWDHIEERIKIRMLAQKNMKENELIAEKNYDWAEV